MTTPAEATAAIRSRAPLLQAEVAPLHVLPGAILREPIVATRDQPPFDRVTMDGIAIASTAFIEGRRAFRIAGTQGAGSPRQKLPSPDTCIEVMTGAVLPEGCDCVVPVERITVEDGTATIAENFPAGAQLNVHQRGLDCRAGDMLLERGTRIGAPELAVIASNGLSQATISRRPRIIVVSTGNELVDPGTPVQDWQIYRSNVYGVLTALQRRGYMDLAHDHMPDDLDAMRARLRSHLSTHDVLILSGGVSMGRFDYVPRALSELGVDKVFHTIEQRPGRPMWFGVGANGRMVFALPGNPVSTLICLARYVYDGLDVAMGAPPRAVEQVPLAADVEVKPPLTLFMPVKLAYDGSGARAEPRPTKGSGDFTSLIGTDGFVELPPGPRVLSAGTVVPFYRW
ncbi:MAG TPA: molybdopterin molybdotransferase MoeA [Steroidobacteraceae bacterium]